jgi:hypothetical protein
MKKLSPESGWVLPILWLGLVAVGVLGRLWQPAYNITPLAAVGLASGWLFPHRAVAAAVPLVTLVLSNMALLPYDSVVMAVVVYAASIWPVLMGGIIARRGWAAAVGGALASSLVFYLSTNLAHWIMTDQYPHSAAGLMQCYVAALPFYRWMPVGDVMWTLVVFAGLKAVMLLVVAHSRPLPAPVASAREATRLTGENRG